MGGIQRQAQELHERYLAAASKTAADVGEHAGLWGSTEPVRTVLEAVLAPLDIVAADHWVDALKEVAGQPAEWLKEVDQSFKVIQRLRAEGKPAVDEIKEAAQLTERPAPSWTRGTRSPHAGSELQPGQSRRSRDFPTP